MKLKTDNENVPLIFAFVRELTYDKLYDGCKRIVVKITHNEYLFNKMAVKKYSGLFI